MRCKTNIGVKSTVENWIILSLLFLLGYNESVTSEESNRYPIDFNYQFHEYITPDVIHNVSLQNSTKEVEYEIEYSTSKIHKIYWYNNNGWIIKIIDLSDEDTTIFTWDYQFIDNLLRKEVILKNGQKEQIIIYDYDSLGRLIKETRTIVTTSSETNYEYEYSMVGDTIVCKQLSDGKPREDSYSINSKVCKTVYYPNNTVRIYDSKRLMNTTYNSQQDSISSTTYNQFGEILRTEEMGDRGSDIIMTLDYINRDSNNAWTLAHRRFNGGSIIIEKRKITYYLDM